MKIPAVNSHPGTILRRAVMLILGLYFTASLTGVLAEDVIPEGFHRMEDGSLMANSASSAVAPPGYHLMPNGVLMPNTDPTDHSAHHAQGGGHQHHGAGMWMFEYKYVRMYMEDFLDTTEEVTAREILLPGNEYEYSMAGTDMTMDMHMFMAMYGISDKVMVMAMAHYMSNTMGMLGAGDLESTMTTRGIGDTVLSAMVQAPYNLTVTAGVSLPTGKIDQAGPMVHGPTVEDRDENVRYPYAMQLGSGTYDLILGLDYNTSGEKSGWGLEYEYTLRTGTNAEDYTLGDMLLLGAWYKSRLTAAFDATTKLQFRETGRIEGEDKIIRNEPVNNKMMSPDMDAGNYGGRRLDIGLALSYQTRRWLRFGAEFSVPLYQNLFGPQMATRWVSEINLGVMF